jgi:hypothetical protein
MADTILTLGQIEDFFSDLTLRMLKLDPDIPGRVRTTWPTSGAPAWEITEDVMFISVNYDDDPIIKQMHTTYGHLDANNADYILKYTNVLRINWTAYGPNSFSDMDAVRSSLILPSFTDQMNSHNVLLITDLNPPMRSPELYNGQWWERTSFYARFNEGVEKHSTIPYFQPGPIQIVKG